MNAAIDFYTDQLAQEIISSSDVGQFVCECAEHLNVGDVARLRAIVDKMVTKDFNIASRLAEAAWEISRILNDDAGKAYAEAAIGRVEYSQGRYSNALSHYDLALSLAQNAGNAVEAAIVQKQRVGVLMYLGKHQEALSVAAQARQVLERNHEQEHLAELETNIGNLHCYLLNQYRKSLKYYERARDIFVKLGNEISCARVEYNLANALMELDRIDEALTLLKRAAQIYHKHEMLIYAGQADYNIAYLLFRQGQFNEALKHYYKLRDNQDRLGDEVSVAWCSMEMAEIYLQLSVFEESNHLAETAQKSFLKFENTFKAAWAQTLNGLALAGAGRLDDARRELAAALEEFSRQSSRVMVGLLHNYLADLELKAGKYQTALVNAQEAERVFVSERLAVKAAFARLALSKIAYLTGDLKRAGAMLRKAEKTAQEYSISRLKYECCYLQGCLYEAAGEYRQALERFSCAIDMIGDVRSHLSADELKSAFLHDKLELFERATELSFLVSPDGADSLRYVEQAKSRSLSDLLAHYVERELAGQLSQPELQERFQSLLNELNWHNGSAQSDRKESLPKQSSNSAYSKERRLRCEKELKEIFRRIQIENSNYAELQQPASVDLPRLQNIIDADEAIVEYFSVCGQISAFIITRDSITTARRLVGEDKAEKLLMELQFQLEKFELGSEYIQYYIDRMQEDIKEYLKELHTLLIAPIAHFLKGRSLVIIPHGLLHYLPFNALYDGEKYLIERHDISFAPSLTVYELCKRKESASDGDFLLLGLADDAAPEITQEVEEIAALHPNARLLLQQEATLSNLKLYGPHCRILHLATHGVVRQDNPLFSYLKLADAELTFYNTFDLKLKAELVTLSACHTGVNRIFPGDELHGLMRGFLYAGTPSMITSLWEVDDRATRKLMTDFYRRLMNGDSKRAALSATQRELLVNWPHPYYWASFILIGKP